MMKKRLFRFKNCTAKMENKNKLETEIYLIKWNKVSIKE